MAAVIVEVADAIVTELNTTPLADFGISFTAERSYADWEEELKGWQGVRVDVVPVEYVSSTLISRGDDAGTRGKVEHVVRVNIGVREAGLTVDEEGRRDQDRIDTLVLAVENIAEHFFQLDLGDYAAATWTEAVASRPVLVPYSRPHLREWGQFTGIVSLMYETVT